VDFDKSREMSRTFSEIVKSAGFPGLGKCAPRLTDVMAARAAIETAVEDVHLKAFLDEITLTAALGDLDALIEQMSRAEREDDDSL